MHHNGLILCGVANGSSPGLSCVVETRQGQGALEFALLANKRVTYTSRYPCIHLMQHKTQIFHASNWLFCVTWKGMWTCHMGSSGPAGSESVCKWPAWSSGQGISLLIERFSVQCLVLPLWSCSHFLKQETLLTLPVYPAETLRLGVNWGSSLLNCNINGYLV